MVSQKKLGICVIEEILFHLLQIALFLWDRDSICEDRYFDLFIDEIDTII